MTISFEKNKTLKALNTFGFDHCAKLYAKVGTESEIEEAVNYARQHELDLFVLGGGSNLVIVNDIQGLVIQLCDKAVHIEKLDKRTVLVSAKAGVNWHSLVRNTLSQGIAGLENLSLIPGSVGAAPVQNIGAYGVEVAERISQVRAFHIPSMRWITLHCDDCQFSYRHSLFKDCPRDYIISNVQFELGDKHELRTSYASLHQHLQTRNLQDPSPLEISESVIAIRQSRLPDPAKIGNAGSFFHNPRVSAEHYAALLAQYPDLPGYPQADGSYKLAAAWLIDNLGFKGIQRDGVAVHHAQALVLINTGTGTGTKILKLASEIKVAVRNAYAVELQIEPEILDMTGTAGQNPE